MRIRTRPVPRLVLLCAALGLVWTTLVAAAAEPPPPTPAAVAEEPTAPDPDAGEAAETEDSAGEGEAAAEAAGGEPAAAAEPAAEEAPGEAAAEAEPALEEPAPAAAPAPEESAAPTAEPAPDEAVSVEPAREEEAVEPAPEEAAPEAEPPPGTPVTTATAAVPVGVAESPAGLGAATDPEKIATKARAISLPPPGSITIVKDATPPDGTDFPFTIEAASVPESFTLDDDTDPTLPDNKTFSRPAGTWTVTETPPAGWEVQSILCDDGQSSSGASIDVTVAAGGKVTCTFTNRKQRATIVIEKSVDFVDDTAFGFAGGLGGFTIDPAGTLGSETFGGLDPDVDFTVTETVPAGWDLTGIFCDDKSSSSTSSITIDPTPGATTTCTFTNAAQEGTITVVKEATPADGTDFPFIIEAGRLPDTFTLDDDADPTLPDREAFDRLPGTWTVAESPPSGWEVASIECDNGQSAAAGASSIDVVLGPGGDVTCTFTNQKLLATIVITKDVDFDDDTVFEFGGDLGDFTIDPAGTTGSLTFANLDPDRGYEVSENVPAGWDLTGIECSDESTSTTNSIIIDPITGGTVTCTFSNAAQGGTVTVVKLADPVDGTTFQFSGDLGAFELVAESGVPPDPGGPPDDKSLARSAHAETFKVAPGRYTIVEDVPPKWVLRNAECALAPGKPGGGVGRALPTPGVEAVVGPGEDVICTFANVKLARLTIAKEADPADGTEFPVTVAFETPGDPGGTPVGSFTLAHGETVTLEDLEPGRYSIGEDLPPGWGLEGADCAPAPLPGSASISVQVGGGADVTCTLRNVKTARITIEKRADIADGTLFPFTGDLGDFLLRAAPGGPGTPEPKAVAREEGGGPVEPIGDGSISFDVEPGTFVVTEVDVPGWELADISCEGGSTSTGEVGPPGPRASVPGNSVEITVAAGDIVDCVFVNHAQPGSLTIVKEAVPSDGTEFPFTFQPGTENEEKFELGAGASLTFGGLPPTTYRVVETVPPEWGVGEIDCGDAEAAIDPPAVDVNLHPGQDVECVFRNTKTATIVIVKQAGPADGTDFHFEGDLGAFTLDDEPAVQTEPGEGEEEPGTGPPPAPRQSEEDLPDRMTFEVGGGTYAVREVATEHWRLTAIDCGQEEPPAPPPGPAPRAAAFSVDLAKMEVVIDVAPGDTLVCVFRNRAKPVPVTIVKETAPESSDAFRITLSAKGFVQSVDVRDGEPQTVDVDPGELTISEQPVPGWGLRSVECSAPATVDLAAGTATMQLTPGRAETCTFTNARTALITIRKLASPLIDTTFPFGGDLGDFEIKVPVPPPEPPPSGGVEGAGQPLGRQASEEGEPPPTEMRFEVQPGTYEVTEGATPGWELVAIACSGIPIDPRPTGPTPRAGEGSMASTDLEARTVTLTVQPGDVVECGFENRQTQRGLTIVKKSVPADGTDFAFEIEGGDIRLPTGFLLDDDNDPAVPSLKSFEVSGQVRVTEAATAGWHLSSLDCDVAGAITSLSGHVPPGTGSTGDAGWVEIELPPGAAATCTFTNTKLGAVTVIKSATPPDGTDFPFSLTGAASSETFALDDGSDGDGVGGSVTFGNLVPGAYSLTEAVPAGWALRDVSCTGAADFAESGATVDFELAPGGNVICTFDDVKLGSLEGDVFLDLNGNGERDPGEPDLADVPVVALWAGFDGEFGTGDDGEFTTRSAAGNSYRFADLPPGTYRVTVGDPGGLVPTRAVTFEIELAAGEAAQGAAFAFAGADLELSVAASTETPRATQPFDVTVAVFNRGAQAPSGVAVRVEVSAGLRVDAASGDGGFDAAGGRWDIGEIAVGATKTLVLTVTPLRAGDVVQVEAEVSASGLTDPDSTPNNDNPDEDDQDATRAFTVAVAPAELLPVTGLESGDLVPPALLFLLAGLVLVAVARPRREDDAPPEAPPHPVIGA